MRGTLSGLKLLVHAYCPSSYEVVRHLVDRGLHGALEIVPLNPGNPTLLRTVVPSVPSLALGGRVVAVDPLEPEFVEALLLSRSLREYVPAAEHEVVERFVRSAKSSGYIMLHVLLGGMRLADVLSTDFVEMAARTYFSGLDGDYVKRAITSRAEDVERELAESSVKSVAYSFLRDVVASLGGGVRGLVNREVLRLWSTAKLSQGVAYTPVDESTVESGVKRVLEYLEEHYDNILASVEKFLSRLESDAEVYELLVKGNRPARLVEHGGEQR